MILAIYYAKKDGVYSLIYGLQDDVSMQGRGV